MPVRHIAIAAALAASLACTPAVFARQAQDTETIDRTIPFPVNGTLSLNTFSGHVTVTATSGRDIVIKAVRRASRDRLDHITLDVTTSGSTVSIDTNKRRDGWRDHFNNVVETDIDVQVPASATLNLHSFSSPISVTGVTGDERLKTFSATITVRNARGAIDAESFSGALDIDATAAGAAPALALHTFSGGITARLDPNAHGDVEFKSFSGRLDSDVALTMHTMSRRNVRAELNGGSGHAITLNTFSGSVKLQK
jgi:DUF4097 and DUF4098 domain-containing protein YvlB